RVVVEDARGAVLAREDAALVGQVHARRVHQVDDRDAAAHRDLLGAEDLRDRLGPPGAGLHGRVVRHDHHLAALDAADPGDDAGARRLPVVAVVRHEEPYLHPGITLVEQKLDALAGRELALRVLALDPLRPPALAQARAQLLQLARERPEAPGPVVAAPAP